MSCHQNVAPCLSLMNPRLCAHCSSAGGAKYLSCCFAVHPNLSLRGPSLQSVRGHPRFSVGQDGALFFYYLQPLLRTCVVAVDIVGSRCRCVGIRAWLGCRRAAVGSETDICRFCTYPLLQCDAKVLRLSG